MSAYGALLSPLALTLVVFATLWPLSVAKRDASLVDLWWGPGFLAQAALCLWIAGGADGRDWLLIALIAVWSLRLGWVLTSRRLREGREDPRYTALREAWGAGFWWKSFFIVFVLQAIVQWAVALGPMWALVAGAGTVGPLGWAGAAIALGGFWLEAAADRELDRFKQEASGSALCDTGLRAVVRHPNYLGEIVFWTGIAIVALDGGVWLGFTAPLLIGLFLVKVSGAPMLDERLSATRPGYDAYRARVPGFLPRPGAVLRAIAAGRGGQ